MATRYYHRDRARSTEAVGPPRPRRLVGLVAAILTAGLAVIFADLVLGGPLLTIDVVASRFAIAVESPLRPYGNVIDAMGLRGVTATLLLGFTIRHWVRHHDRRPFTLALVSILALNFVVGLLKLSTARGTPLSDVPGLFEGGMMWPSGHASNVSLTATMFVYLLRRYNGRRISTEAGVTTVIVPSMMMTAISLVLGYHWFSDLLAGVIVGVLVASAVIWLDGGDPWVDGSASARSWEVSRRQLALGRLAVPDVATALRSSEVAAQRWDRDEPVTVEA